MDYEIADVLPKSPIVCDSNENTLVEEILNNRIQEKFDVFGYDRNKLRTMFEGGIISANDKFEINCIMTVINDNDKIPLKDIVLFFSTFVHVNKALSMLEESTRGALEDEVRREYGIGKVRDRAFFE